MLLLWAGLHQRTVAIVVSHAVMQFTLQRRAVLTGRLTTRRGAALMTILRRRNVVDDGYSV